MKFFHVNRSFKKKFNIFFFFISEAILNFRARRILNKMKYLI